MSQETIEQQNPYSITARDCETALYKIRARIHTNTQWVRCEVRPIIITLFTIKDLTQAKDLTYQKLLIKGSV